MNRYFVELAYDGTSYYGWQNQPHSPTVQGTIENMLSVQWREKVRLTGCGRTDTGVHARSYFAHLDTEKELSEDDLFKINAFLPEDIAIRRFVKMNKEAHARYDALQRRYRYYIHFKKSVFVNKYSLYIPDKRHYETERFQSVADTLSRYDNFKPFCLSGTEVKHYGCRIDKMNWSFSKDTDTAVFTVEANRFLHGMIRLIVGCTLYVASGHMEIEQVIQSMDSQQELPMPYKAPARGLILDRITYPYICSSLDYEAIYPACANG